MLQNWNDQAKSYHIDFSDLKLDPQTSYLVYRFWDQKLLGQYRNEADLNVNGRIGEAYAIREVPKHPWVLSTDMHLTQGGVELESVGYDESSGQIKGVARRHPGAEGQVVLYLPSGYKVKSASGAYSKDASPSGAEIVHLKVKFAEETSPWWMTFDK